MLMSPTTSILTTTHPVSSKPLDFCFFFFYRLLYFSSLPVGQAACNYKVESLYLPSIKKKKKTIQECEGETMPDMIDVCYQAARTMETRDMRAIEFSFYAIQFVCTNYRKNFINTIILLCQLYLHRHQSNNL